MFWGLYFILRAIKESDLSLVFPYLGSMTPILTWLFAFLFIGDVISPVQLLGILIIVIGGLILEYEENLFDIRKNKKMIFFVTLSAIMYSISSTIDKYLMNAELGVIPYAATMSWIATFNLGIIVLFRHRDDFKKIIRTSLKTDFKFGKNKNAVSPINPHQPPCL